MTLQEIQPEVWRAVQALRHDEERIRALVEHSSSDIALVDRDGRLIYSAPSAEGKAALGYRFEELAGKSALDLIHPNDRLEAERAFAEVVNTVDASMSLPLRLRHRDGGWRHMEVVATNHLTDDDIQAVVLNLHDITAAITAEHRQDILLETLTDLDVSAAMIEGGRVIRANAPLCRLTGYSETQLIEMSSILEIVVEGQEAFQAQYARQVRGQLAKNRYECVILKRDGQTLPVEAVFRVSHADDRDQFMAVVEDITDRKRAEAAREAEIEELQAEVGDLRREVSRKYRFESVIGKSPAMNHVYGFMETAIDSGLTVLIGGPTGTGKDLIAKAIHYNSPRGRDNRPPIELNCGAAPKDLVASMLFGHRKGAFTGADRDMPGIFEAASGNTLILDEIGEMAMEAQVKLLRVLEERSVQRLGENHARDVDVRVIAITNRKLRDEIEAGRFREDLYFRLRVLSIQAPALSDRREDIPLLAEHFLEQARIQMDKAIEGFASDVLDLFDAYSRPGNVRELRNAVLRAAAFAPENARIERRHLPAEMVEGPSTVDQLVAQRLGYKETVNLCRRRLVEDALRACDGNRTRAAQALGMGRPNLLRIIREFDIAE